MPTHYSCVLGMEPRTLGMPALSPLSHIPSPTVFLYVGDFAGQCDKGLFCRWKHWSSEEKRPGWTGPQGGSDLLPETLEYGNGREAGVRPT